MTSESGRMEKSMAWALKSIEKLPKEKRKALEAKMAQNAVQWNGPNMALKACLPPAMAKDGAEPLPQEGGKNQNGCTIANVSRESNNIRSSFFCANDDSHGERLIELDRANRFIVREISTMYIPITFEGKEELLTILSSFKFLSAACGDIKPSNE